MTSLAEQVRNQTEMDVVASSENEEDLLGFAAALKSSSSQVKKLSIQTGSGCCKLSTAQAIGQSLLENDSVENIKLSYFCDEDDNIAGLAAIVESGFLSSRKTVEFEDCHFSDEAGESVSQALAHTDSRIEHLGFKFCKPEQVQKVLLAGGGFGPRVKKFAMTHASLTVKAVETLEATLKEASVEELDLTRTAWPHGTEEVTVTRLAQCIKSTKLKKVNLCDARLTNQGAMALGRLVSENPQHLEEIDVQCNHDIDVRGCDAFVAGMEKNTHLKKVILKTSRLSNEQEGRAHAPPAMFFALTQSFGPMGAASSVTQAHKHRADKICRANVVLHRFDPIKDDERWQWPTALAQLAKHPPALFRWLCTNNNLSEILSSSSKRTYSKPAATISPCKKQKPNGDAEKDL